MSTHSPASSKPTLRAELDALHDEYAEAINYAIAAGHDERADGLAAAYDEEATRLVAEREGKTHLLPLVRGTASTPPRRRMWRRRAGEASTV